MKKLIIAIVLIIFGTIYHSVEYSYADASYTSNGNSEYLEYKDLSYSPPRRGRYRPPSSDSRPPVRGRSPIRQSRRSQALVPTGWEVGVNLGTAHSLTEIGGSSETSKGFIMDTQFATTSINAGVFGRYRLNELSVVNASFNYGHISGADSLSPPDSPRYNRGFYFHNNIYELAVKGEVYFPRLWHPIPLDIYGYLGTAVFYHNPVLTVPDPDRHTFEEFSNFQLAFPMGLGAIFTFGRYYKVGLDIGWRKTFTNYLNGFTRPASTGYNSYYFTAIKMSYFFDKRPTGPRLTK